MASGNRTLPTLTIHVCSHVRPVAWDGHMWCHLTTDGSLGGQCEASVYRTTEAQLHPNWHCLANLVATGGDLE